MRRRAFIAAIGALALSPLMARAQQSEPMRRVGALLATSESDVEEQAHLAAFTARLKELGWIEGHNLRLEIRWGAANDERNRRYAAELIALTPEVILADNTQTVAVLQRATRAIPIVVAGMTDPVGAGFVKTLARPGGNITGFAGIEYAIAAKWLELLKAIAPGLTRVAVLREPNVAAGIGMFAVIEALAPVGMELSVIELPDELDNIDRAVAAFARHSNGGLIVTSSPFGRTHRDAITALVARHKLPAIYPYSYYVRAGGLLSYGYDVASVYRPAADYVDRILKGEKPADLPVQAPTKYELVINLKTAQAFGIEISPNLLAQADEVIE